MQCSEFRTSNKMKYVNLKWVLLPCLVFKKTTLNSTKNLSVNVVPQAPKDRSTQLEFDVIKQGRKPD